MLLLEKIQASGNINDKIEVLHDVPFAIYRI